MADEFIVYCDYCGDPAALVSGMKIYPHRRDLAKTMFWECEPCDAYVGTHKNSIRHMPYGRLAKEELRRLKSKVHALFDKLWKKGTVSRSAAYRELGAKMGLSPKHCHIGKFDEQQCRKALEILSDPPAEKIQ